MAPPKAPLLPTAKPKHSAFFDPWNSSSTGHQRAENKVGPSNGWRLSRTAKLSVQFRGGASKQRESENSGEGGSSNGFGDIRNPPTSANNVDGSSSGLISTSSTDGPKDSTIKKTASEKGVFNGLVIYINGSTYPLISDHKLKHLLAEHGAKVSIHLGRKQLTHVIVGAPSIATGSARQSRVSRSGAGAGLASGKIQKEIQRVGRCGVKYVGVEWALESIKVGRRLPEAQFANMKLSLNGQQTVRGNFFGVKAKGDAKQEEDKTRSADG